MTPPFTPRLQEALSAPVGGRMREIGDLIQGILNLDSGVACAVLKKHGFERVSVEMPEHQRDFPIEQYSPDALRALSIAISEAIARKHSIVGVEDLLIGILKSGSKQASRIAQSQETTVKAILKDVCTEY